MTRTGLVRGLGSVLLLVALAACSATRAPATNADGVSRTGTSSDAALNRRDMPENYNSIVELIESRAPGVQVIRQEGTFALRIRGVSSPSGNNDPLIVIDGLASSLPGTRALDAISPQDVLRIEVLKDAATTAYYGMRGGSGVILITTRKK